MDMGRFITSSPEIRGGRTCVAGTGVSVRRIVGWYKLGLHPEEIADRIGHLNLAQVYAALAYYFDNQKAIEADIAAEQAEAERLEREHMSGSTDRGHRLNGCSGKGATIK